MEYRRDLSINVDVKWVSALMAKFGGNSGFRFEVLVRDLSAVFQLTFIG